MSTDTRSLRFEARDTAQMWRVFLAVEETAKRLAEPCYVDVRVRHGGGEYHRASVADSQQVAERNGFLPYDVSVYISPDESTPILAGWISAFLLSGVNQVIEVRVSGTDEVRVNGEFVLLEKAINHAKAVPVDAGGTAVPAAPKSLWSRLVNHPYSVQIGGSLTVAGILALLGYYLR